MNVDLSIIIVNYNVKEFLQNLIYSIYKATQKINYEIIIVDNASDDGSVEFLQEKFPNIKLIVNENNLGFSKANNIGLSIAMGKYILLLNPDTIVQEDTFERMINFFERTPDAGMAGCKILNPDGTLQLACRRSFPGPWTSFCKVTGLSNLFPGSRFFAKYNLTYLDENQTYEVDAISGSFMMIRKETYEKVGKLDEQFFMYGEDLDWCYRVQNEGYKVYYVHDTQIIHYKGESTKRSSIDETKIFYNAMHLFVKKHFATSFIVEIILQAAIVIRKFIAFLGRRKTIIAAVILDFILYDLSLLIAERFYNLIGTWRGFHSYHLLAIYTVPALIHITLSSATGCYKKNSLSILRTLASVFISFFVISSVTFFFKQFAYSRAVVILTYVLLFFTLSSWRIIAKFVFNIGINTDDIRNKRTLIVGVSESVINIASRLKSKKTDFRTVVGLIGLSNKDVGQNINDLSVIGSLDNMVKVIHQHKVNEVILSSRELSYNQMMKIVSRCQDENVEFKLIGNNLDFIVGKTSVSMLDDIPLIQISYNISTPLMKFIKSAFDFTLSTFVLFFIYPFIYFITKVSKKQTIFRKFILSVPQVFIGKVSFVGPQKAESNGNLYLGKKGLTGLWFTENTDERDYEKLDIFYAKNQNVWLDLEILGKTLNKMWNTRQ
jgi:GT2 family glycosyltransferase